MGILIFIYSSGKILDILINKMGEFEQAIQFVITKEVYRTDLWVSTNFITLA